MLLGACAGTAIEAPAVGHVRGFLAATARQDWDAAWDHLHPITQREMFAGDPGALASWCDGQSFGYPWESISAVQDGPGFWRVEVALRIGQGGVPACLTEALGAGHALASVGPPGRPADRLL